MNPEALEQQCINTLRVLSADMVEQAKSGHPGLPLGAAGIAYVLWTQFLRHNPKNPQWPNRDRFVLSAGHGCALWYSLLHVTGYDLPLEELQRFRQWGSKTPGHPEYGLTPGVEATTGPLGQGFANAVGMAMAERFLAGHFNRPGFTLVDHYTYVMCSDGDMMEGISAEAASIAGHLRLGKLIAVYLDDRVSLEGPTDLAFSENVSQRFAACGWQVLDIDGLDTQAARRAFSLARADAVRPSLIRARTHLGFGSPHKQDTAAAHGEPLGEQELKQVKERFGFPPDRMFYLPDTALDFFRQAVGQGAAWEYEWLQDAAAYAEAFPGLYASFQQALQGQWAAGWDSQVSVFPARHALATREASGQVLNALEASLPLLAGGSADLAPSTMTRLKGRCDFGPDHYGCPNFHFGVREHAMAAIANGLAVHGQLLPYCATFLAFSDYLRPALRLAALMNIPVVFVFTHDSIGLGEDGPTHQPVEQLMSLRSIPQLTVIRPADANETACAWRLALALHRPVALALSRQRLPILDAARFPVADGVPKGAYVLSDCVGTPDLLLLATGSEVHLALAAQQILDGQGVKTRVVSMPSWELFRLQPQAYRDQVLLPSVKARLAIEAGVTLGWSQWVGDRGDVLGLDHFGASAPGPVVLEKFGFTADQVVKRALALQGAK